MIRFEHVTKGLVRNLSFDIDSGTTKILFDSEDRKNQFFRLLAGLRRPESGKILFFGEDLFAREEDERVALFQRIGVVPADGGMISNLKAWENLLLPAWLIENLNVCSMAAPLRRGMLLDDRGRDYREKVSTTVLLALSSTSC